MRLADYLALAFRSLRRSRLRSGLTVAAIVVGATGITIMLTFVTSVKNEVVNQFVQTGQVRQIQVSETPDLTYNPSGGGGGGGGPPPQGSATLTQALEVKIAAIPHVTGVAGTAQGLANQQLQYLAFGAHKLSINDLQTYQANGVIEPTLVAGRNLRASDTANVVVLSSDYADALGFSGNYAKLVGQTVELHTGPGYAGAGAALPNVLPPQNQCNTAARIPGAVCGPTSGLPAVNLPAVVVGVVTASNSRQTIFLPLSWAIAIGDQAIPQTVQCLPNGPRCTPGHNINNVQRWTTQTPAQYLASQGGYGSFIVAVDNTANVAAVADSISHLGVSAATGLAALHQQQQKANVIGLILGVLGLVALSIAALGVMNTMVMSVLERTREIGVMRALGARRSTIRRLFTMEAAGLGFFGGLFGVVIGYGLVLVGNPIISKAVKSSKVSGVNFSVPLWLVFVVIGGTTLIGFISGLIPARRAARLDPVEALRYE